VETGVQRICNYLKELDSCFCRNDKLEKYRFLRLHQDLVIVFTHYSAIPLTQYSAYFIPSFRMMKVWNLNNEGEFTHEKNNSF
jgi:hypothetical protein